MVSFYQMRGISKLTHEGWIVLGVVDATVGGRTLMQDPHGKKFAIGPDGGATVVPDDTMPLVQPAPESK